VASPAETAVGDAADRFAGVLSPLRIGRCTARNRVVVTGHGAFLDFYRPGESPDRYVGYLERRAAGGVGTVIMQPMHVHPSSHALGHHTYDPRDMAHKFAAMSSALHREGALALVQLFHFGAQFTSEARRNLEPLWAFSPLTSPEGERAHEMDDSQVEEIIDAFVDAAVLAIDSGMDGVELHAAHGYLLQQSFSPWANQREDRWGDPLAFATEVVSRVRRAVGEDAVAGLRISADDFVPADRGGLGAEGLRAVAAALVGTGHLDYLNHSVGSRSAHYARAIGSYRYDHGHMLDLSSKLRGAIGARVPVVGVGRITTLDEAEAAIGSGRCDLVAMTRAHIADPDVVAKARSGRLSSTRPCVGANQGCVDRMTSGLPITCFHNPAVGRERTSEIVRTDRPRTVLVVGGGPAGLMAAETAALAGHRVTLAESTEQLGGRLRHVLALERANELFSSIDFLAGSLDRLGVTLRLGTTVDGAALDQVAPDAVVIATGARHAATALDAGDGTVPVCSPDGALDRRSTASFEGVDVLVVDVVGNQEVALVVERLATDGARVVWATPALAPGWAVGFTLLKDLMQHVSDLGALIETSTAFVSIERGLVTTRHVYRRVNLRRRFDLVVAGAAPVAVTGDLAAGAAARGIEAFVAGDAVAPRNAMLAFREGFDAARALDRIVPPTGVSVRSR
jgi:2,4-dienoyl-CoA reductase-like NADH-dependent reductase (Old Yellow Enzyme family)